MLIADLPPIRGTYRENEPLAPYTTIKVGGPAEVWADFADWDDLQQFLATKPTDMPLTLIGEGSNMVIREGGIRGVVTHLGKGFDAVMVQDTTITAEAGATCGKVARAARTAGLAGLAFYGGIPGSVGGALNMNAGAYGSQTFDFVEKVTVLTNTGEEQVLTPADIPHRYRHTELPAGWLFKSVTFKLQPGDAEEIRAAMRKINHERTASQPIGEPSSGSWFKNPTVGGVKLSAWRLADEAGCRGLRVGDAQVSEKHSNFFINLGAASATDLLTLSDTVAEKIKKMKGIEMEREVKFIGESA